MPVTFPAADALTADVLGARPGADPSTGAEAVQIALQVDDEDPQVFSLSICAAYHLRDVIDAALKAPFWWEEEPDDDQVVLGLVRCVVDDLLDPEALDRAWHRSVRWDETWASTHPR